MPPTPTTRPLIIQEHGKIQHSSATTNRLQDHLTIENGRICGLITKLDCGPVLLRRLRSLNVECGIVASSLVSRTGGELE